MVFKQIGVVFKSIIEAFSFSFSRGFIYYYLVPLFIYLSLFLLGFSFSIYLSNLISDQVNGWLNTFEFFQEKESIYSAIVWRLSWVMAKLISMLLYYQLSTFLVLILLSPVLAHMSERVVLIKTGEEAPFSWKKFLKDIVRGIVITTRNSFIQFSITILCFILGFIPIVGFFALILGFVFSFYFIGFSFMDYSNEQQGLNIKESSLLVKRNKYAAILFGAIFYVISIIPFFGGFLSSLIIVFVTCSATLYMINYGNKM